MSGVFVHNSEQIFKDALKFDPDRWLQPDSASLDNWLVAFSKGPRACIGQKYFSFFENPTMSRVSDRR
jgi:cytochrome P450